MACSWASWNGSYVASMPVRYISSKDGSTKLFNAMPTRKGACTSIDYVAIDVAISIHFAPCRGYPVICSTPSFVGPNSLYHFLF